MMNQYRTAAKLKDLAHGRIFSWIIFTFIVCHSGRLIFNAAELYSVSTGQFRFNLILTNYKMPQPLLLLNWTLFSDTRLVKEPLKSILYSISQTLIVCHCACNVIIYLVMDKRFANAKCAFGN